ncbi:MAG: hypothetical protein JWN57_806 [Frankiales bacterium]|jgi:hypothetical protein|nr:hypothetical protein [Frankiales bacterium]
MSTPDELEQGSTPTGDGPRPVEPEVPVEADEFDVLEQAAAAGPGQHAATRELPLEADPVDAQEQAQVVELDEDERR